jgi:cytochrome c5
MLQLVVAFALGNHPGVSSAQDDAAASATPAAAVQRSGKAVVNAHCAQCHETGIDGAPKIGDLSAWIPHLTNGLEPLVRIAIDGHGHMPPRGGAIRLTDREIRNAIVYMFDPVADSGTPRGPVAKAAGGQDVAVVGGMTVYFGVMAGDLIRSHPKEYPQIASKLPQLAPAQDYVTISLFDTASRRRIDDAIVKARVSTGAVAGPEETLQPMSIGNSLSYGNFFTMSALGPLQVTVDVWRPGLAAVVQAQFDYTDR